MQRLQIELLPALLDGPVLLIKSLVAQESTPAVLWTERRNKCRVVQVDESVCRTSQQ